MAVPLYAAALGHNRGMTDKILLATNVAAQFQTSPSGLAPRQIIVEAGLGARVHGAVEIALGLGELEVLDLRELVRQRDDRVAVSVWNV